MCVATAWMIDPIVQLGGSAVATSASGRKT
jgi:hypothetical protein